MRERTLEKRYPKDPVLWIKEKLGEQCWSKQREVLDSLVEHKKTLVMEDGKEISIEDIIEIDCQLFNMIYL